MSKALTTFDYGSVDKDTKSKLIALAGEVKRHNESFRRSGLKAGEALHSAHEVLAGAGKEGCFTPWVEAETDIGTSTAYNLLNVYRRSRKFPILETLPSSVAYLLAPEKVPDAAIKEVEKAVNKGQRPTVEFAKSVLDKFRDAVKRSAPKSTPVSATSGDPNSTSSAPDLPAEGTGDQAETGEQGKGTLAGESKDPCADGHDFDDEACRRCHEPRPEEPVGKLFSQLLEHLRKSVLLLDEINRVAPNDKARQSVFDSFECANQDILKWRKSAKRS